MQMLEKFFKIILDKNAYIIYSMAIPLFFIISKEDNQR
jgi:hypothetical protein